MQGRCGRLAGLSGRTEGRSDRPGGPGSLAAARWLCKRGVAKARSAMVPASLDGDVTGAARETRAASFGAGLV